MLVGSSDAVVTQLKLRIMLLASETCTMRI
jgi:hypothetical protein